VIPSGCVPLAVKTALRAVPARAKGKSDKWHPETIDLALFGTCSIVGVSRQGFNSDLEIVPEDVWGQHLRIFVCKPDALYPELRKKIPCPHCRSSDAVGHDGWQYRHVYDVDASAILALWQYRCDGCPGECHIINPSNMFYFCDVLVPLKPETAVLKHACMLAAGSPEERQRLQHAEQLTAAHRASLPNRTFRAIDDRVQASLPLYARTTEFKLTHKGAITVRLFDQLTRAHELGMSGSQFERSVQAAYRQTYQQVQLKYWALCGDLNRRKRAELAADGSRHGLLQGFLQPAAQQQRQIGSGSTAGARATAAAAAAAGGAPSASAVSASATGAGGSRQRQGRLDAYLQPQLAAASAAVAADGGQTDAGAASPQGPAAVPPTGLHESAAQERSSMGTGAVSESAEVGGLSHVSTQHLTCFTFSARALAAVTQ